uniref:Pleiotropic regulator 1 n=1 Tax=Astyanax mexicanus TaxID=7994 RepID=A0A8B9H7U1_ASTMX
MQKSIFGRITLFLFTVFMHLGIMFSSTSLTHCFWITFHKIKMAAKLRAEYGPVLHMPVLKEVRGKPLNSSDPLDNLGYPNISSEYLITGTHPYPSAPGVALTADTGLQKIPSEAGVQSMALALPPSQTRQDVARTAASVADIHRHAGSAERSQPPQHSMNTALIPRKAPTMPKPQWHPPWKLYRVISGHLGWVRSIAVEPGNQWFVTGSADRTIKVNNAESSLLLCLGLVMIYLYGIC